MGTVSDAAPAADVVSDAAPAADVAERIRRERAMVGLLRQFSSGLSAYRLFPGDLGQSGFLQACDRIASAARAALADGPLEVEIHGDRMLLNGEPLPEDERIQRFALICYQQRAERLIVHEPPRPKELGLLFEELCKPVGEGRVGSALRVAGITSIAVIEYTPQALDPGEAARLTDEQRDLWGRLGSADAFTRELVEQVRRHADVTDAAKEVFERLKGVVASLPEAYANGFELYRRLQEVVARLPRQLRRAFAATLIERVQDDTLADRLVGTMTDAGLARMLVELGQGPRALELARELSRRGIRRGDLLELTAALLSGRVEGGTILAGLERVVPSEMARQALAPVGAEPGSPVVKTMSSLLARGLLSMGQEDVREIREEFPVQERQIRTMAFDALADYLRVEDEPTRFAEVMTIWVGEVEATLRRRDEEHLTPLIRAMRAAMTDHDEKGQLAEASFVRVLNRDLLRDLVSLADGEGAVASTIRLLEPFGEPAVEALLEEVAAEQDRGRRALLLAVTAPVAASRPEVVARRMRDPRWYVARNAVTILHRIGTPEVAMWLSSGLGHKEPAVRREAIRALVDLGGEDSLNELLRAVHDEDPGVRGSLVRSLGAVADPWACRGLGKAVLDLSDQGERRAALEALGGHPSPAAAPELERLADARARPRLPRRLRKQAKALLRQRKAASR